MLVIVIGVKVIPILLQLLARIQFLRSLHSCPMRILNYNVDISDYVSFIIDHSLFELVMVILDVDILHVDTGGGFWHIKKTLFT
jgi:hypothetical protein